MNMLLLVGGVVLSAGAILMLALMVTECLGTRGIDPDGRRTAGATPARWLWAAILAGSFALGLNGLSVWTSQRSSPPPAMASSNRGTGGPPALRRERTLRLPFLVLVRRDVVADSGEPMGASSTFTLQVPWVFLLGAGLYARVARRRVRLSPPRG